MNPTPLEFEKPILDLQLQLDELLKRSADQSMDVSAEATTIREKLDQLEETTESLFRGVS